MSLDELAAEFPTGTRVRIRTGDTEQLATVHGVTWTLPKNPGGPDEPGLVVMTWHGIGCAYPSEVAAVQRPGGGASRRLQREAGMSPVKTDYLPKCKRCRKAYGDAIPTPTPDGLCGPCRHLIFNEGGRRALDAYNARQA